MKAKTMTMMAVLGGMGVAGYMYMKKNPIAMHRMKKMVKGAAKRTYEMPLGNDENLLDNQSKAK